VSSDPGAVLAGDRLGDADEQDGGDDRQDEAQDVELPDAAVPSAAAIRPPMIDPTRPRPSVARMPRF